MHQARAGRVAAAVFLLACALLAWELLCTRIFSVIIWNHFAFLAISVALFGFGVAGIAAYLRPQTFSRERAFEQIRGCALLLPPVITAVVALLCALPIRMDFTTQMFGYLAVVFLASSLPFAVGGLGIALALTHWPRQVNRIYAFDLIGSALGCLLVIGLLDRFDGPTAAIALGILPALAALVLRPSRLAAGLALAVLACVIANDASQVVRVRVARSRVEETLFEAWNAFSRVTVVPAPGWRGWWVSPRSQSPPVPALGVRIDADALTPMVRFDGDLDAVRIVLDDVTAVAYRVHPDAGKVLVIGAGGGKDVLAALASGAGRVRAVELNPLIARDVVSDRFRDFSGDLYRHERVELVVGEGRTVLRHDDTRYDVLQLSMVDTSAASAAGAYALTENSLYTLDAAREFLAHVAPGGLLTVTWANFPNLEGANRLVSQFAEALRLEGREPVSERLAVVGSVGNPVMPLYNVLVRPEGFSPAEVRQLRGLCTDGGFRAVYLPGDPLEGGAAADQAVMRRLIAGGDLESFYDAHRLDLRPVGDDRPFFFYQNRFRDAWSALSGWDQQILYGNGMVIIAKLALISAGAVAVFMGLPLLVSRRTALRDLRGAGASLVYFTCLGVGFIALEIALLQTFAYYLGHPLLGLGVSLASLLLFTGLGSALGSRWRDEALVRNLRVALLFAIGLALVDCALLPLVTQHTIGWSVTGRCAVAAGVLAPLGVALGLPFPTGLRLIGARTRLVPWMWAINSGATVLGSTYATLLVIHVGFSNTLLAGAAVYGVALATAGRIGDR